MRGGERKAWSLAYRPLKGIHPRDTAAHLIPYRFEFANKLAKEHKLLLAFDALVLSEAIGRKVNLGKIVHGDRQATLKVKIPALPDRYES